METHVSIQKQKILILLCFLTYVVGYIGRYSYNSNLNLIIETFSTSHAEAGLVTTLFFFAYGAGQVIHGLLCKFYPRGYTIPVALIGSAIINFSFFLGLPFQYMKWLWLINGFLQASLWPSLMITLSENLDDSMLKKGILAMSLSSPLGMVIIYGVSAVFSEINFKISFFFAGISLVVVGLSVLTLFGGVTVKNKRVLALKEESIEDKDKVKRTKDNSIVFISIMLALFAVMHNFVKDGLQTWVPAILKESYGLSDSLSIVLSLVLSTFSVFGSMLAIYANKYIKNFLPLIGLFFLISTGFIGIIVIFMNTSLWLVILLCFIVVICFMNSINNVIIAMSPLQLRDKVNSGVFAGVLNGFCYLGSTISSYGLGVIADNSGWNLVFYIFLGICAFSTCLAFGNSIKGLFHKKAKTNKEIIE